MILHEAQGDVGIVTKSILRQLQNPEKACTEHIQLVAVALDIIVRLVEDGSGDDTRDKFMNSFLKDDLIPLTMNLLSFVTEHHMNTRGNHMLREDNSCVVLGMGLRLLQLGIHSQNGPHWADLLFKHGFLRTLACLPPFFLRFSGSHILILKVMLHIISLYLSHRFVIASAVKAVNEITVSGDIAKLEASAMREPWMAFTNLLLERTALKAAYERDLAVTDGRQCENVRLHIVCPTAMTILLSSSESINRTRKVQEDEASGSVIQVRTL